MRRKRWEKGKMAKCRRFKMKDMCSHLLDLILIRKMTGKTQVGQNRNAEN